MKTRSADAAEYHFLTLPGARIRTVLDADTAAQPELLLASNRAGLLSLANVLLWLVAHAWRREFLSLDELGFIERGGSPPVRLRLGDGEPNGRDGRLAQEDRGDSLEWAIAEDDLRRVALRIHELACCPAHEYDRLRMDEESAFGVQIRMTDAEDWLAAGLG